MTAQHPRENAVFMGELLTATALIEAVAGLVLMCGPGWAVWLLLGTPLEAAAAETIVRIGGAGLLALGVACWSARTDIQSRTARGLVIAMWLYNVFAVVFLTFAGFGLGLTGFALWPGVILHAVMSIWCLAVLRGGNQETP